MPRSLLVAFLILDLFLAGVVGAVAVLAPTAPIHPESALFPAQDFAEQAWAAIVAGQGGRLSYQILLANRRSADLEHLAGTEGELAGLQALNRAVDRIVPELAALPASQRTAYQASLLDLSAMVEKSLAALQILPKKRSDALYAFSARWNAFTTQLKGGLSDTAALKSIAGWRLDDPPVQGLYATNQTVEESIPHQFFPLMGRHLALGCTTCHIGGGAPQFSTPTSCAECHKTDRPPVHYPGDCKTCHTSEGWQGVKYNHAIYDTTDCASCHESARPSGHYQGQCSMCHTSGTTFTEASFDHQKNDVSDCASCHESQRPANHYEGQCSTCHVPGTDFKEGSFDHLTAAAAKGALDCASCHESLRPANHYQGQCSTCHIPGVDWKKANFDHAGAAAKGPVDCASCHASARPSGHFSGQCSTCHTDPGGSWKNVNFNHAAAGGLKLDCQSCHASARPSGHFSGQCSACHTDPGGSWKNVNFNHTAAGGLKLDCQSCHESKRPANHYGGQCSLCHTDPGGSWSSVSFNHAAANATNCTSCHESLRPAGHLQGQCSQCHDTTAWAQVTFTHTFPLSHGKAGGACQTCHTTGSPSAYSCFSCHDQARETAAHAERGVTFPIDCMICHKNGEAP